LNIDDIRGHILNICLHKEGARIMQDELVEIKKELINAVIAEIEPNICVLSSDINGN